MQSNSSESIFTDANKLISHLTQLAVNKNNVFRGYGRQSELMPNIIREKDWRPQEISLLYEFEKYGLQYFSANSPIDFMSYAQHYGLPTRLLDFTYNPFTALSFALFMPKSTNYAFEEDSIYYYIRYCNLEQQIYVHALPYYDEDMFFQSGSFSSKSSKMIFLLKRIVDGLEEPYNEQSKGTKVIISYFKKMYSDDHPEMIEIVSSEFKNFLDEIISKFVNKKILFVDANQCNQRIVMQQGLFLFPYTLDSDELLEIVKNNTSTIKIHKDLRGELLDYLDTIGLNTFRLMPDLQSVCHAVKRKVTEERQAASPLFKKKTFTNIKQDRSNIERIHNLLKEGFGQYKRDDGYANIASTGSFIKRKDPDFDVHTYGFSKLSDLIMSFPDKYEVKRDYTHRVPIIVYRCLD